VTLPQPITLRPKIEARPEPRLTAIEQTPGAESPSGTGAMVVGEPGYRSDAHAVIIGIDHYNDDHIPDLQFARADAEAVYGVLVDPSHGRFPPTSVTILLDEQATKREIRKALSTELPQRVSREDTVFVYYAGLGAPAMTVGVKSRGGLRRYLVPADANVEDLRTSAIAMEDLQGIFRRIDCGQILFFIDSCYSGAPGGRTFERPDYRVEGL
jgi:uncharacterized caspase-like protein